MKFFNKVISSIILFYLLFSTNSFAENNLWKLVTTSYGAKVFHSTKIQKKNKNILETWVIADYYEPKVNKGYKSTLYNVRFNCENFTTSYLRKIKFSTNMALAKDENGNKAKTLDLLDTKEKGKWYQDIKFGWWTMSAQATCNYKFKKKEKTESLKVQKERLKELENTLTEKEFKELKKIFDNSELKEFLSKEKDKWKFIQKELKKISKKELSKNNNKFKKSAEECLQENNKDLDQCKKLNKKNKKKLEKEQKKLDRKKKIEEKKLERKKKIEEKKLERKKKIEEKKKKNDQKKIEREKKKRLKEQQKKIEKIKKEIEKKNKKTLEKNLGQQKKAEQRKKDGIDKNDPKYKLEQEKKIIQKKLEQKKKKNKNCKEEDKIDKKC